jgi:hypothetical protein
MCSKLTSISFFILVLNKDCIIAFNWKIAGRGITEDSDKFQSSKFLLRTDIDTLFTELREVPSKKRDSNNEIHSVYINRKFREIQKSSSRYKGGDKLDGKQPEFADS